MQIRNLIEFFLSHVFIFSFLCVFLSISLVISFFIPIVSFILNLILFAVIIFYVYEVHKHKLLSALREKENKEILLHQKEELLKGSNSYINQLSNVIAGLNHEVSPWLGGINNKMNRIKMKVNTSCNKCQVYYFLNAKIEELEQALNTAIELLKTRSKSVKSLQKYSNGSHNVFETLFSWVNITIVDRSFKDSLSYENLRLNMESLRFDSNHSPILLSQVILNLVKNSIEHNPEHLEKLLINITGDEKRNCIIYEDNGKGIPESKLSTLFEPGITTKKHEKEIHGLGLSLCQDYCETMGAAICVEKSSTGAKFVIYFSYDFKNNPLNLSIRKKIDEEESYVEDSNV